MGVRRLHALAGIEPAGVTQVQAWGNLVAHLRFAARLLAEHGIALPTEPNLPLQYDVSRVQRLGWKQPATP